MWDTETLPFADNGLDGTQQTSADALPPHISANPHTAHNQHAVLVA
jgi:hypothetical protein